MSPWLGLTRRRVFPTLTAFAVALAGTILPASSAKAEDVPGTRPAPAPMARALAIPDAAASEPGGLQVVVNERGHISKSIAAGASSGAPSTITVRKPANATVRGAYLATATTGYRNTPLTIGVVLAGSTVSLSGEIPSGISSYNYFADVTSIVKPKVDAEPAGAVALGYEEPEAANTDGSVLVVVYDDPAVTVDQSVTVLYGALKTAGDTYEVKLASPIKTADPATRLEMSLGISYSYQESGSQQYSTVDVNGKRLSSAAGGEDDGYHANGGLITAGGEGDDPANPADSQARPGNPRSDDELYDLLPFVADGATTITVNTTNPSNDDNVFLATFTMNPPVVSISNGKPKFVYVALGDSYQSGEGAGYAIRPANTYLDTAFENGHNYPAAVGAQENTYTNNAQGDQVDGNSCHRALRNYAKINRDKIAPDSDVVLIDRTCSGATIQPSGKPAIVGTVGHDPDATSQLVQALNLLKAGGLTSDDVDLVTVGMGGNDARFGDIVETCVGPGLLEAMLQKYPNTPREIEYLSQIITCKFLDDRFVKTGPAIDQLKMKELYALEKITGAFGKARVLQLDYPNILPFKDSPEWCGGIRAKDVEHAKSKLLAINAQVKGAVAETPRAELVDVEPIFGPNALCPAGTGRLLANGIEKSKFDTEVTRLLNLDGRGDAVARGKLDALVAAYNKAKSCYVEHYNPLGDDCDTKAAKQKAVDKGTEVLDYINAQQERIFANVVSSPGTTDDSQAAAFDRSRNLFHPNADGFAVDACAVLNVYTGRGNLNACTSADDTEPSPSWWDPIVAKVREALRIVVENFRPGSLVSLRMFSTEIDLGTVTANADGTVDTTITVPDVPAGVHRIQLQGEGAGGVQMTQQILVRVEGRPSGGYTTYLTGFSVAPETSTPAYEPELVRVSVGDVDYGEFQVDRHGGVLVTIPVLGDLASSAPVTIRAVSLSTGKAVTEQVRPIPTRPSLWASDRSATAISVEGARFRAEGLVHSEGGVRVRGAGHTFLGGVEFATAWDANGGKVVTNPAPVQAAAAQGMPQLAGLADFRPGGAIASTASAYSTVPASECASGVWRAKPGFTGIVYVPCAVVFGAAGTYPATYAAEGTVTVTVAGVVVGQADGPGRGMPGLVSGANGAAISLLAADVLVRGQSLAPQGTLRVEAAKVRLLCGAVAERITLNGADNAAPMADRCFG